MTDGRTPTRDASCDPSSSSTSGVRGDVKPLGSARVRILGGGSRRSAPPPRWLRQGLREMPVGNLLRPGVSTIGCLEPRPARAPKEAAPHFRDHGTVGRAPQGEECTLVSQTTWKRMTALCDPINQPCDPSGFRLGIGHGLCFCICLSPVCGQRRWPPEMEKYLRPRGMRALRQRLFPHAF